MEVGVANGCVRVEFASARRSTGRTHLENGQRLSGSVDKTPPSSGIPNLVDRFRKFANVCLIDFGLGRGRATIPVGRLRSYPNGLVQSFAATQALGGSPRRQQGRRPPTDAVRSDSLLSGDQVHGSGAGTFTLTMNARHVGSVANGTIEIAYAGAARVSGKFAGRVSAIGQ